MYGSLALDRHHRTMSVYSSGTPIHSIVADVGSYATKIGFAGEEYPRSYFRSNVAILREEGKSSAGIAAAADADKSGGSSSNSNDATDDATPTSTTQRRRQIQQVNYDSYSRPLCGDNDGNWEAGNPVNSMTGLWYDAEHRSSGKSGADWADLLPTFLEHGYSRSLGVQSTKENPLFLIERSYNPPPLRQQMLEICMEEMEVPAVFFGRDATMSCYACGRTTGTVVDVGYNQTTVTPVFDGYVEQKGIRRSPIGSMAMDELALSHLDKLAKGGVVKCTSQIKFPNASRNPAFLRLARLQIAKDCRESGAGQSVTAAASKSLHVPSISYTLPDGQTVDVPSPNRFEVAELVLGRPATAEAGTADGSDKQHAQRRRDMVQRKKEQYVAHMAKAATPPTDEDDEDADADAAQKYNEATAVGISQRRTKRGAAGRSGGSNNDQVQKKAAATAAKKCSFNNWQLQHACNSYFQAHVDQLTDSPIASMICDAAYRCDRDQQASLLGNVVLGGGGACIGPTDQAVPDLLKEQVEAIIHTHTPGWRVKVLSPGRKERSISSWLGGSILGSLGAFHEMWITKAEYEECGAAIINRKCP